ncbi:Tdh Threonine dehydrogenase and related Zn-dependent dehydrogenases [Candidatus Nanopelagicaceae bacterium]
MEVSEPVVGAHDLLVEVERVGICGTDVEFFTGDMAYLASGEANFPLRIGHEWCGRVIAIGESVDSRWLNKFVTSDTMLGCQKCQRCLSGFQYLCSDRDEVGIRRGFPGALAEKIVIPDFAVLELPDDMDPAIGAMVEPTGNALRAVDATNLQAGERLVIFGPGTIGILCALIAHQRGIEVHIVGVEEKSLHFARQFGFAGVHPLHAIPQLEIHSIIDATFAEGVPALALELIEPGRSIVFIGISGTPSLIDSRTITLKDLKIRGILSASPGLVGAIELLSKKIIDPRPLIAGVVSLDGSSDVLSGNRSGVNHDGPKIHIKP